MIIPPHYYNTGWRWGAGTVLAVEACLYVAVQKFYGPIPPLEVCACEKIKNFVLDNQSNILLLGAATTLVACSPLIYKGVKSRLPTDCGEVVKQFFAKLPGTRESGTNK